MNTQVLNSLKHTRKATVTSQFPHTPCATLVKSSAEDSVHTDLHTSNSLCISLQVYTYFSIFSFSLSLFFFHPSFLSLLSHFLERHRNRSQVIIKVQQNQQSTATAVSQTEQRSTSIMTTEHLPWGCDWSEVFTHSLDNSSAPDPETHADPNPSIKQQPDRSWCFLHDTTLFID